MTHNRTSVTDKSCSPAFLVFANDVVPAQREIYEIWHGEHHVPQRLTVPGIISGTRYKATAEGSPEYLTLYHLGQIDVLCSAPYRALVEHPDQITRTMRPLISKPVRLACHTLNSNKTLDHPFLVAGVVRATNAGSLAADVAACLESTRLPFLIGLTDMSSGGHPTFQQHEEGPVLCILVSSKNCTAYDKVNGILAERWNISRMPLMQRIDSMLDQ